MSPRTRSANFSLYLLIVSISVALVLNPLVVSLLARPRLDQSLYLVVLDAALLSIAVLAFLHIRTGQNRYLRLSIVSLAVLPFLLVSAELGWTLARVKLGSPWKNTVHNLHRPDPLLGWTLLPDNEGRHVSPGNYDVVYSIDPDGRRATPQAENASRSLHFFGNSFIFGQGVPDEDAALYRLGTKMEDRTRVLNYGVIGYGIEQMFYSFNANIDNVKPGDVVVFTPISSDLKRNLIHKEYFCRFEFWRRDGYRLTHLPVYRDEQWSFPDLADNCSLVDLLYYSNGLPVGTVFHWYMQAATHDAIIGKVDRILSRAADLAQQRGARFRVVFLVTPKECREQVFEFDLEGLRAEFDSLMPYCPTGDGALEKLKFPRDPHWSTFGNEWAAGALERVLRPELEGL